MSSGCGCKAVTAVTRGHLVKCAICAIAPERALRNQ